MKKEEARFTIKFNPSDPIEREMINLLNGSDRRKAAMLKAWYVVYAHYKDEAIAKLLSVKDHNANSVRLQREYTIKAAAVQESVEAESTQSADEDLWQIANDSLGGFFS